MRTQLILPPRLIDRLVRISKPKPCTLPQRPVGHPFTFNPDLAIELWQSGDFKTAKAVALHLGAKPAAVAKLLRARGAR